MSVAKRLDRINPSEILSLVQKAANLSAAGHDIIDLGIGDSDFPTPNHVFRLSYAATAESLAEACEALQ